MKGPAMKGPGYMKGPAMKDLGYIKRPATVGPATKQCGRDILLRETSKVHLFM